MLHNRDRVNFEVSRAVIADGVVGEWQPLGLSAEDELVTGIDDPRGEPPSMMARAALLLASEPASKVNGRVTYSQQILKEFGWIEKGGGRGVDTVGSGYSQI